MQIHPLPVNVHSLTGDCRCTGNLNKLPKCGGSPCLFSSGFQGLSRLCSTGLPFHSVIEVHICVSIMEEGGQVIFIGEQEIFNVRCNKQGFSHC